MARVTRNYQHALRQNLLDRGFSIKEESDNFVWLTFRGIRMDKPFTQHATLEELNKAADKWWKEMMR